MNKSTQNFAQIQQKLKLLDKNQNWLQILSPWLKTELTYTSNSLEGNTLSLLETSLVINENQSIGGKNLREIYEAKNHAMAWDYMQHNLLNLLTAELVERHFLEIHSLILRNIDDFNGGKYRNVGVRVAGSNTIFPNYLKVNDLMTTTFHWLHNSSKIENTHENKFQDILEIAFLFHLRIVKIHPFSDGNGRTTRLFMNAILMQNNYPPLDILPSNRLLYLQSLESSTTDNPTQFLDFCFNQYNQNLDTYLATFDN